MWNSKPIIFSGITGKTHYVIWRYRLQLIVTSFFLSITLEYLVKIIISCGPSKWWRGIIEWLMDFCNDDRSTLPMHIKKLWWKTNFSVFFM